MEVFYLRSLVQKLPVLTPVSGRNLTHLPPISSSTQVEVVVVRGDTVVLFDRSCSVIVYRSHKLFETTGEVQKQVVLTYVDVC